MFSFPFQETNERRLLTTFLTASITISISFLVLNFPTEKRIELNAATSSKPIAVKTWEGSIDAEVQADPEQPNLHDAA